MDRELTTASAFEPQTVANDEMNWDAYAEHYDVMCDLNPAYQDNIDLLTCQLGSWGLSDSPKVLDLGAGTGNYILAMARQIPKAKFTHVDFDTKMNELAKKKYAAQNVHTVDIVNSYVQEVKFPRNEFDLIICINALYAISPQDEILKNINSWLKPNGIFFVIDFGRKQNILDWTMYVFRESLKHHKVGRYVKTLLNNRELIRQNRQTTKGQDTGRYWLHSTTEFTNTLANCGFEVTEAFPCYRGYSDLAICRKDDSNFPR